MSARQTKKPLYPPNRVKELRDAAELTQTELAEKVGTTHATVQRIETRKQQLTDTWLYKLAKALKRRPVELLKLSPEDLRTAKVVGAVAAGVYLDAVEWPYDEQYELDLPRDDRYPGAPRFGLEVRGTSMNLVYPPGTVVICVKLMDIDRSPRQGDHVVVQRYDQDKVEATLKEILADEQGRLWLWPRSSDPQFQQPWPVPDNAEEDSQPRMRIWAVVTNSIHRR